MTPDENSDLRHGGICSLAKPEAASTASDHVKDCSGAHAWSSEERCPLLQKHVLWMQRWPQRNKHGLGMRVREAWRFSEKRSIWGPGAQLRAVVYDGCPAKSEAAGLPRLDCGSRGQRPYTFSGSSFL